MIETLTQIDKELFFLINGEWTNSFLDWIMPLLRDKYFWTPVYVFLVVFFLSQYRWKGFALIALVLLAFGLADFTSASIIKPAVERLRPCNDLDLAGQIRVLVNCGSGFSFVSSHAANHFAISFVLIGLYYRKWKWVFPLCFCWALVVSYAQVYVGVHYPLDILCGAILGILIGLLVARLEKAVYPIIDGAR